MKKLLACILLIGGGLFAQDSRESTISQIEGTTNYYGSTVVTRTGAIPSTNDLIWKVEQVINTTNGVFISSKQGFGLVNGISTYEVIRWSDILSTNVVYK